MELGSSQAVAVLKGAVLLVVLVCLAYCSWQAELVCVMHRLKYVGGEQPYP